MEKLITVTGLPRSGTAFVSMLLQMHPDCVAYHELAAYDRNWRTTLFDNWWDIVADCNTYAFMPEAWIRADKMIMIESDVVQSHVSSEIACRKLIDPELMPTLKVLLDKWRDRFDPMVIRRNDVFTFEGCVAIWEYCFGKPVPYHKIQQLVKLNVQHKDPHIKFGPDVEFII